MTPHRHGRMALLALALLGPALPAAAQPVSATYTVHAAGLTLMELQATLDITDRGYSVEFRTRMRGLASAFASGQNLARVEGVWEGDRARPRRYVSEGVWRGEPRRTVVEWPDGSPVIRVMVPPNEEEREPVSEAQQRNTVDSLSALAQLVRQVRRDGTCNGGVRVYDGRRLTEMAARTGGQERFPPARDEWFGTALRCNFEGRYMAGYRKGEDVEAARRPQTGTAWLGQPAPGLPVVPVRVEHASRWLGTLTMRLASAGPPGQLRSASN